MIKGEARRGGNVLRMTLRGYRRPTSTGQSLLVLVRLENIQTLEFLVQDSQRLEALRLVHLRFEPILDFILSVVF